MKRLVNKSSRDKYLLRLLKSPAIKASGVSSMFLPENPSELCDRLNILLQKEEAGKNFNIINEEIVALADKLLEYKCMSTEQHKFVLLNCLI